MFCSCSCEEAWSVAELVSNSSRSNSNQVVLFTCADGSVMNRSSRLSMPFCGMFRPTPSGSEVLTKAPSAAAPFPIALPACCAVAPVWETALSTELLRVKNQIRPNNSSTRRATGQSQLVLFGRTTSSTRGISAEPLENPAGRKLRSRGNSPVSMPPKPDTLRFCELTFDARVPRTRGAAATRTLSADDARMPDVSAIWAVTLDRSPPKSVFKNVLPDCATVLEVVVPTPAAAPNAFRLLKWEIRFMI